MRERTLCRQQMMRDLMQVYREVYDNCGMGTTQTEVYKLVVQHPAQRFYVDARRAHQRINMMMRGDMSAIEHLCPLKRQMYRDLYDVVMRLYQKKGFWHKSVYHVVKEAVLEGTFFTPGTPTEAVPTTGLPMSRIVKGVSLQETTGEVKSSLGTIDITRAVSKIKFAFARSVEHPGEIIGIELNNRMIAAGEYVFPEDSLVKPANYEILTGYRYLGDREAHINKSDANNTYINETMLFGKTQATFNADTDQPLVANENIQEVKNDEGTIDPSMYVWTNWVQLEDISPLTNQQKAVQYHSLMNYYTRKTVYLRESDRALQGKIYYRLQPGTPVKTAEFNMIYTDLNDFTRNHIWIVYGYFLGDKFNLIVQTIPWEDSEIFINYTQTVSWKDGGAPSWTPTLTDENSGTETFEEQQYTMIYTNGGDTPSLSFTLDSPEGWEWVATLEPLTDGAANFISFADGSTVATGNVGQSSTLNFRIATTSTSVNHRVRLRLFVRTTSGDQSLEVQNVKYIISRNI